MARAAALTLTLLALGGLGTSTASARGEFRREVPRWWIAPALCVHHYEGSWQDPDAPYYGGMQMDWSFMHNYGPWTLRRYGTADHWPWRTQLLIAYRGWRAQGWGAWPNSAHFCGLI